MNAEELLRELEAHDDEATVEVAAEALAAGLVHSASLEALLNHRVPAVRRAALRSLAHRPDPERRALLEARLTDPHGEVRAAACQALAALGDPGVLPALLPLLADRALAARSAAAGALGSLGAPEAVPALARMLGEERTVPARAAAVAALGKLGERPETREPALGALLAWTGREPEPAVRAAGAGLAARLAEGFPRERLLTLLRQVPLGARRALGEALANQPLQGPLARFLPELQAVPPDPEVLGRLGSDLTQRAREGRLGRAYGREREVQAILERLHRPGVRGVVLVGPSGAGKTAIVHEVARRLAEEPVLVSTVLHEGTTGEVLSGTRFLGEWQTRLKELIEALSAPRRAVWYVPDLNRLVDAGTTVHSDESFATMLGPALERGELAILGESTPEAFRRGLDRFPGFGKLFWKLQVEPSDLGSTLAILREVVAELVREQAARGVTLVVPEAAVERALELADEYISGQVRPGNAVGLLREAVVAAVQEAEAGERAAGEPASSRHSEAAASPRHSEAAASPRVVEVPPSRVLATLSALTGVPVRLLDDTLPLDPVTVRAFFAERVLGQDEAVDAMVDLIALIKAGLTDPTRPLGVFCFVGPTGVGKTEMAKAVAEFIFGSAERLVRIDLGEFKEPDAHRRLVGDLQAVEPAARSGLLTAPVRERPFSVVLLDELEKAHRNVFDLLLPLMAEGRLVDEQGRVTDFRRTIVIMTSNLGSDLREDSLLGFGHDQGAEREKIHRALEETFRPEFLNRLGKVIVFAPLTQEVMRRLTRREVRRVLTRRGITRRRHLVVETDEQVIGILLKAGFSERWGARPLKRRVEELLLQPLARALLKTGSDETPAVIRLAVGGTGEAIRWEVIRERPDEPEEAEPPTPPEASRSTARIKDIRAGRLISLGDLEERVLELHERIEALAAEMEAQDLRGRKKQLVEASTSQGLWEDPRRASGIMSEIHALEQTLELPRRLAGRMGRLEQLVGAASRRSGETRALHALLAESQEVTHEVELAEYALRCRAPEERGDAWIVLRRVGEGSFPEDPIAAMARMYLAYWEGKGAAGTIVYEALGARGAVREATLHLEGMCAYGLLRGEAGLHQWVARGATRRDKRVVFVRAKVLPQADQPLRAAEVTKELRAVREEAGVLVKKPRQHLVLTHLPTLVAVDGTTDGRPETEEAALGLLAARVARRVEGPDPGVVRRYLIASQPVARDFATGLKLPLERVLEGRLEELILGRLEGAPPEGAGGGQTARAELGSTGGAAPLAGSGSGA